MNTLGLLQYLNEQALSVEDKKAIDEIAEKVHALAEKIVYDEAGKQNNTVNDDQIIEELNNIYNIVKQNVIRRIQQERKE